MIDGFDRDSRLRAIAMNAIREARVASGRADSPYTDDDALRAESVFSLLHVQTEVNQEYEHYPLVPATQAPVDNKVSKIAHILGKIDDLPQARNLDEDNETPVKKVG